MKTRSILIALFICFALRAITLEYPDLIDPTESRYAFVAQEMVLSGDWIVPKLPWKGEVEPYLGKPPLHFWLTAGAFSLLGMDEWVARLPSFISFVLIVASLWYLKRYSLFRDAAPVAALIAVCSALMYFMGGASVVDMTLTAWVTVSCVAAYALIESTKKALVPSLILFTALALGFLTKGPIALLLVGIPAFLWIVITKNYSVLTRVYWLAGAATFALVTIPWFVRAQDKNSDFLRYFFINENFGRYFLHDYGDRYGSGHHYPFGTVWVMLLVGFLPWSIPFVMELWKKRREFSGLSFWRERPHILFSLLWALSPALIFTFTRQLHFGYVLPAIPGLALLAAFFIREKYYVIYKVLTWFLGLGTIGALIAGALTGATMWNIYIAVIPFSILMALVLRYPRETFNECRLAIFTTSTFAVLTLVLANNIGESRSAEVILRCLSHYSAESESHVGLINANSYSMYFYSRAWQEEFEKPITLSFFREDNLSSNLPLDVVIRTKELQTLRAKLPPDYEVITSHERWTWLRSSKSPLKIGVCPNDR